MFTAHEVAVDARFAAASARLADLLARDTLRGASGIAYDSGIAAVLRVGPFGGVRGLSKLVDVRFLAPVRRGATVTVALRWEAAGAAGDLFPVLDGDLILAGDGPERCRLAIVGAYRPPLGWAGVALDRAILGRIAAATMRSLLANVADSIALPTPGLQQGPEGVEPWPGGPTGSGRKPVAGAPAHGM